MDDSTALETALVPPTMNTSLAPKRLISEETSLDKDLESVSRMGDPPLVLSVPARAVAARASGKLSALATITRVHEVKPFCEIFCMVPTRVEPAKRLHLTSWLEEDWASASSVSLGCALSSDASNSAI